MAELFIRTRASPDGVTKDRYAVGDVIVIVPDGHPWSKLELNHGAAKIVKVPGVDPGSLSGLLASDDVKGLKRAQSLDLSKVSKNTTSAAEISSATVVKK